MRNQHQNTGIVVQIEMPKGTVGKNVYNTDQGNVNMLHFFLLWFSLANVAGEFQEEVGVGFDLRDNRGCHSRYQNANIITIFMNPNILTVNSTFFF